MRISVITPNYNGAEFLETAIRSVVEQKDSTLDLEYIIVDGGSQDGSGEIFRRYRKQIDILVVEPDTGPANAINKGFAHATGDIVSWLNSDDIYYPGTFTRVQQAMEGQQTASFCFGRCPIVNEKGEEIRRSITRFKELFFPFSSRFVFQSINYISQPSLFFRRTILDECEPPYLREDMVAAWDYEFFLRLWNFGHGIKIQGGPLAAFRWHDASISGQFYKTQFKEELDAATAAAGKWAPQTLLHHGVRWGIVTIYSLMSLLRQLRN